MRTSQLYMQDNSAGVSTMYTMRFDATKSLAAKRQPTLRHSANISQKLNKHVSVLSDCRINYDTPLPPTQVAAIRAERIARDKNQVSLTHGLHFEQICYLMLIIVVVFRFILTPKHLKF